MAYTTFRKLASKLGFAIGRKGQEKEVIDSYGTLVGGVNTPILKTDGTVKACLTNGLTLIAGGSGIADLTIGAPKKGDRAILRVESYSSGDVIITADGDVTFDGTNDIITLDGLDETIVLVYKGENEWAIELNVGGALSST